MTICWTDPAGQAQALNLLDPRGPRLVNDLDLRIDLEGVGTFGPFALDPNFPNNNAILADNFVDNVEKIVVPDPTPGMEFVVRVSHKDTLVNDLNQPFGQEVSMIISGNIAENAPSFAVNELQQTAETEFTLAWDSIVGADYRLEFSDDLVTWLPVSGDVNARMERIAMSVPAPNTKRFWRTVRLDTPPTQ